jgi:ABC-type transport system substrate-binding protein
VDRREWLLAGGAALAPRAEAAATPRVLRAVSVSAESGFDPPGASDAPALRTIAHIFESPLTYDYLARPARLVPQTAVALPEVSADFRHFVFTIRPGILFADDPAFGGQARELTAADYVYTIKRFYDPQIRTEHLYQFENAKILGLSELRRQALQARAPFPYDLEVAGLRTLDRYRFEVRLAEPAPRFVHLFASPTFAGAVAREVVQAYGDDLPAHPVGTGPFMLHSWRRGSKTVLVRNPRFREQVFSADPPADHAVAQFIAARLRGRKLPLLDRIEISVIDESQPRWLAFLGGELDVIVLPVEFASLAMPAGRLAPYLARRGVQADRTLQPAITHTFFNFDDPLVGGYTPDKVALRRAVALAYDSRLEASVVYQGEAVPAQGMIPPHCYGYDPAMRSQLGSSDMARAQALLDIFGYLDRNGDGWREQPDGSALSLRLALPPHQRARRIGELWSRRMKLLGLHIQLEFAPFAELIKRALAGRLMMWGYSWYAANPDGDFFLGLAYGPNAEQSNDARFRLAAFDRLYQRQTVLSDGPERLAVMHDAARLMTAYVPYIPHSHPYLTSLTQPHVGGYLLHPFASDTWRFTWVD